MLYNDACSEIPAEKHPWILGKPAQEGWSDGFHDRAELRPDDARTALRRVTESLEAQVARSTASASRPS